MRGRVVLDLPGMTLAEIGPVVVYLETDGAESRQPGSIATLRQKDARFVPEFLAVAAGQDVAMPNDDLIFHNVFSYSKPNDFDLGLYPSGDSRTVPLRHPGVVKIYCSIHETMNGTIFVSPSPWFTVAAPDGSFSLPGAPTGRARLRTWNERLPDTQRAVEIPAAGDLAVEVPLVP